MFKKFMISAIIITAVFAAGSAVYAQAGESYSKDTEPVFELLSDIEETKTFSREYIISGNASEGTEISVDSYWFLTEDEKSIISNKRAMTGSGEEGSWIFQDTQKFSVGASGLFLESVPLNLGLNRIVLYIRDNRGNSSEMTFELERFLEKQASKEMYGNTINKAVEDMSNSIYSYK